METKVTDGKPEEARRKRTPEEMKQIEDLSKAALGWDSGSRRSNFRAGSDIPISGAG